ncbi:acyl-CoA/acyl-ACP dehydrogenase [Acidiferrimicrobium sp. IK]|uniref:acyl-CoA dehydrogenase family protein n=1 Tax=Acidiferrimicrobium sp. IK TaxID=2871700 RepID=UPI0021CB8C32|nr:acyl-CoA dehydrogenase family protein [Acidiferrimicrobium sp. IK]MCU4184171.1 acyl-CoA/acyl-ACP dehydrogenase [Acidiferrimicrobium sp. IK]
MDFELSEDQHTLVELTRRILRDKVTDEATRAADAEADRFDRGLWAALADAGVIGIALPEAVGGGGLGVIEQTLVLEEMGRALAPVPVLASIVMGAAPVARFATPAQRERWLPGAIDGTCVLTAAFGEAGRGAGGGMRTDARRDGTGWRLTGAKTAVPALPIADAVVVPAAVDGGVAVFLVATDAPGVGVERQRSTGGWSTGALTLDGVRLEADAVLGGVEHGAATRQWILQRAVLGVCAHQLGVLEQALAATAEYATGRVQFERPIATFQAVGHRLADCYIDVEAARLTLWQAAWRLSEGLDAGVEVGVAKYWAAEAGHRVGHAAVHIHGGMGVAQSHSLHRYFLAAKANEFLLGGATEHLLGVGDALAASDAPAAG